MQHETQHTLIPVREVLKIITWTTRAGLRHGCRGTNVLTQFPHGLYSKEECIALRDSLIKQGIAMREKREFDKREIVAELV
jgi:hypothetical protein